MEQKLIQWIKTPTVFRSVYFISCMIIAFGLGIITEYSIVTAGSGPEFEIPEKPTPLALRYKNTTNQNPADFAIAVDPVTANEPVAASAPDGSARKPAGSFVASKTGTKYYPIDCSGVSRIKTENRIYFASEKEAEEKGYTRTETCK